MKYHTIYTHTWAGVQEELDSCKAKGWRVVSVGTTSILLAKGDR